MRASAIYVQLCSMDTVIVILQDRDQAVKLSSSDLERITKIRIRNTESLDEFVWMLDKHGKFTVKSAYHFDFSKHQLFFRPATSIGSIPNKF